MELTPTKVHIKADRSSYSVARETQDLAQSFFALSFILEGGKEASPPKQKTSQGHIHYKQAPAWGSSEGNL